MLILNCDEEDVAAFPGDGTRIRNVNKARYLCTDNTTIHGNKTSYFVTEASNNILNLFEVLPKMSFICKSASI
jgi:hypothetical protein